MTVPYGSASRASIAGAIAALLACSADGPPVRSCSTSAECPAYARCISGACVANAPPSTAVALPPDPLETNVLLSFDASATADHDDGDSIVSFSWAFRAVSGQGCAVPTVAGAGAIANVRFGCAGRYAVDVTATDQMGAAFTATEEFDVAAYEGTPLVTAGDDVPVGHLCTPVPRCIPDAPVTLHAEAPGIPDARFVWTVEPPADRPLTSSRRVTFSPSAAAASPSIGIETDGDPISGDWIFRVVASDAAGELGSAAVRVSVGNRLPVVTKSIPTPDHLFAGSQFTAAGEVTYSVTDPDGDAVLPPTVEWRHAGDGPSVFAGTLLQAPARVTFTVEVPYAAPADASHLIGGAGLERTISFAVSDANGGRTLESWPIVVGNRPPSIGGASGVTASHTYDAASARYLATASLSPCSDPDGDPLFQVPGSTTGDATCPTFDVVGGAAEVACALPFSGTPAMGVFAGSHVVTLHVQDPWREADAPSTVAFTIANRAPTITSTAPAGASGCTGTEDCCGAIVEGLCEAYEVVVPDRAIVPSRWSDPDGDPVAVQVGSATGYVPVQPLVCSSAECSLEVGLTMGAACPPFTSTPLPMTISDGAASTSGTLPMKPCG